MFDNFSNLKIESKYKKACSLILTLIGIVFILASNYVGYFAMRLAVIAVFIFTLLNFKMTYKYLKTKEKINHMILVIGAVLVFVMPNLLMLILAAAILYLSLPIIYKAVRKKDYNDKIMLIISSIGILFALYCAINSKAALNTVIVIAGIVFVVVGSLIMYEDLEKNKKIKNIKQDNYFDEQSEQKEYGFVEVE